MTKLFVWYNSCVKNLREVISVKCQRCGKELGNSTRCNFCGYNNIEDYNVREMSNAEKKFYNGVTIDVDSGDNNRSYNRTDSEYTSYQSTYVNYGGGIFSNLLAKLIHGIFSGSIVAKIIAGIIFLAFAAFMFFVALPIFFTLIAIGIIVLIIFPRVKSKFWGRRF